MKLKFGEVLLNSLGDENASSIQRFNVETGSFETLTFLSDGQPAGMDFPITPCEGCFIFMKQEVLDFMP
jgi:hypothetical protein